MYYDTGEIDTLADLMLAVKNSKTGGYEVDFNIRPNFREHGQTEISFFTIIDVISYEPNNDFSGQYWFDLEGKVEQVL